MLMAWCFACHLSYVSSRGVSVCRRLGLLPVTVGCMSVSVRVKCMHQHTVYPRPSLPPRLSFSLSLHPPPSRTHPYTLTNTDLSLSLSLPPSLPPALSPPPSLSHTHTHTHRADFQLNDKMHVSHLYRSRGFRRGFKLIVIVV